EEIFVGLQTGAFADGRGIDSFVRLANRGRVRRLEQRQPDSQQNNDDSLNRAHAYRILSCAFKTSRMARRSVTILSIWQGARWRGAFPRINYYDASAVCIW